MSERFAGQVVLVVGGAHGIGAATAHRFAAEGAHVVIADRELDAARERAASLPGGGHAAVACDVTDPVSVDAAVDEAVAVHQRLDVLAHVAGGVPAGARDELDSEESWTTLIELNLRGAVRATRAAAPHLAARERSAIVLVSSVNADLPIGGEAYGAAKAGLESLMRGLAVTHAAAGLRVNAVAPGTIRTRVWDARTPDRLASWYPLGRIGEPEDVAAAIAFLASEDAAWITGHVLPVDGGLRLLGPGRTPFPPEEG